MSQCDTCMFYNYDEYMQEYYCDADFDEDEYASRMSETHRKERQCPYYGDGDEYKTVRHQM